jgi:hypothetical protein
MPRAELRAMAEPQLLFWVYENKIKRYAAIHRANCGFCNQGEGIGVGYNRLHASWRGPFASLDEAARLIFARPTLHGFMFCNRCLKWENGQHWSQPN